MTTSSKTSQIVKRKYKNYVDWKISFQDVYLGFKQTKKGAKIGSYSTLQCAPPPPDTPLVVVVAVFTNKNTLLFHLLAAVGVYPASKGQIFVYCYAKIFVCRDGLPWRPLLLAQALYPLQVSYTSS